LTGWNQDLYQRPFEKAFYLHDRLVRFHLEENIAFSDMVAYLLQPSGYSTFFNHLPQLWQADGLRHVLTLLKRFL
jgi:hypothetical protein